MYYNRKKEMMKNILTMGSILLIAIVSTYYIYNKFKTEHNIDYNSKSLEVVFHEKSGDSITLDKVTPLTDSVGLSTKAYTFTIKNNLTEPVKYKVKLEDDLKQIEKDNCSSYQIPKNYLRVSFKDNGKDNKIYDLSSLSDGVITSGKLKALEEGNFTIRVWINRTSGLPNGSTLHYHGKIQVIENDNILAIR